MGGSETYYCAFCERIRAYVMSYELGIHLEWDIPILRPHPLNERYGAGVHENLRLTVANGCVRYYQRASTGEEREVQPEGPLEWLTDMFTLYSPATEDQLQLTEALLGFSLPPLLRALYKQVGNGGFGPGYDGIFHLPGEEDYACWALVDTYILQRADSHEIDLSLCEQRSMQRDHGDSTEYLADWEIVVPQGYWPERFLPICQQGCNQYYYLDIPTGRVFFAGSDYLALRLVANSLEELFERWMQRLVL